VETLLSGVCVCVCLLQMDLMGGIYKVPGSVPPP
jgi:hypothetical protein